MHVHGVVEPLTGDLSIHFTQCCRGYKGGKVPEWEELVVGGGCTSPLCVETVVFFILFV